MDLLWPPRWDKRVAASGIVAPGLILKIQGLWESYTQDPVVTYLESNTKATHCDYSGLGAAWATFWDLLLENADKKNHVMTYL